MKRLGVVGAGTMGSGIAELGVLSGFQTVLFDPMPGAIERGVDLIGRNLRAGAERGRWLVEDAEAALERLHPVDEAGGLGAADIVIEAVPESFDLKREVLGALAEICSPNTVLASNTSSIPITSIAACLPSPSRVVGMHFFNPVPRMQLVEIIPAQQTDEETIRAVCDLGEALGKRVIVAQDVPGFLVNRCGRPFYGEALRLLQERVANVATIDRICRVGGGFRMGPFELMDLVGIDVGFDVAKSFADLSFGEPRWRPTPLQARMAASGEIGRKAGSGWYTYGDGPYREDDPESPAPGGASRRTLAILGSGRVATRMRDLAVGAGFSVSKAPTSDAVATFVADDSVAISAVRDAPCPIVTCGSRSLAGRRIGSAVGFTLLAGGETRLIELTRTGATDEEDVRLAGELAADLGLHAEWVADSPGLVLGRIVAQIVNEACFALGEGLGTAEDIDDGVRLGLNYPNGPLAWAAEIGWSDTLSTLAGLWEERREERYRPAPALIAASAEEQG